MMLISEDFSGCRVFLEERFDNCDLVCLNFCNKRRVQDLGICVAFHHVLADHIDKNAFRTPPT